MNYCRFLFIPDCFTNRVSSVRLMLSATQYKISQVSPRRSFFQRVPEKTEYKIFERHDSKMTCFQISENLIATGYEGKIIRLWDTTTGKFLRTLRSGRLDRGNRINALEVTGSKVISCSLDDDLKIWDAESGRCVRKLKGHCRWVDCMHLHGNRLCTGSCDNTVRLWNLETSECTDIFSGHKDSVDRVFYDGKIIISSSLDETIKVWDIDNKRCIYTLHGHKPHKYIDFQGLIGNVPLNTFKYDGAHIVSTTDNVIRVWNAMTGVCLHNFVNDQSDVSAIEFRGDALIQGNADGSIKVWDVLNGRFIGTLAGKNKPIARIKGIEFCDNFIIVSSHGGEVKLWNFKTGEFIKDLVTPDMGFIIHGMKVCDKSVKLFCAKYEPSKTTRKLLVLSFNVSEN